MPFFLSRFRLPFSVFASTMQVVTLFAEFLFMLKFF